MKASMEYRCLSDKMRLSSVIPGVMDGQNGLPDLLHFAEGVPRGGFLQQSPYYTQIERLIHN